jgi:hypothetical protein
VLALEHPLTFLADAADGLPVDGGDRALKARPTSPPDQGDAEVQCQAIDAAEGTQVTVSGGGW